MGLTILPIFFTVIGEARYLVSCGHWDNSFKISAVENGRTVDSVAQHKGTGCCRWHA